MRGVQARSESRGDQGSESIWTFRIERYDDSGNRVSLIPVEMRGLTFEGSVSDGDSVRASGRMRAGTLRVTRLENLTTGATVRSKGVPKAAVILAVIVFAVILIVFAWLAYQGFSGPPPGFEEPE